MTEASGSKAQVSVVRSADIEPSIRRAVELLGGIQRLIKPGDSVLIKPNFAVNVSYETGIITDPRVVESLIVLCREASPGRVIVGESGIVGINTGRILHDLGLEGRFEGFGAQLVNLDEDEVVKVQVPGGALLKSLQIYRTAYESDVIISVPSMKTHILTGVTLGLKNMKGILPDGMKRTMHRIGAKKKIFDYELEHAIADLASTIQPSMTLIDGFIANEGYKPGTPGIGGTPVAFNTVVGGFDTVAVDAVGAYLMGFDPGEIKHIAFAQERGAGVADLERIEVLGADLKDLRREFQRPSVDGVVFDFKDVSMIVGRGCSGCREASIIGLSGMTEGELERIGKAVLVIGSDVELQEQSEGKKVFLVGNCTFKSGIEGEKIEGCPPPGIHVKRCLMSQ